jgi:hypothetical protein
MSFVCLVHHSENNLGACVISKLKGGEHGVNLANELLFPGVIQLTIRKEPQWVSKTSDK